MISAFGVEHPDALAKRALTPADRRRRSEDAATSEAIAGGVIAGVAGKGAYQAQQLWGPTIKADKQLRRYTRRLGEEGARESSRTWATRADKTPGQELVRRPEKWRSSPGGANRLQGLNTELDRANWHLRNSGLAQQAKVFRSARNVLGATALGGVALGADAIRRYNKAGKTYRASRS